MNYQDQQDRRDNILRLFILKNKECNALMLAYMKAMSGIPEPEPPATDFSDWIPVTPDYFTPISFN